jgi:hypothetical protein
MLKNRFGEFHLQAHNEFFEYFAEQWLENEEIPVVLWSCYHTRHRNNNAVEGWNNKVNSFEKPNLNIKKVLGCLQKEEDNCNPLYMRMTLHLEGEKKDVLY